MLMKVIVILKIVMIMTYYDYDSGDGSDCDGELEDDSRTQTVQISAAPDPTCCVIQEFQCMENKQKEGRMFARSYTLSYTGILVHGR